MFKNYLKVAFRNIFRQKTYSFINIFGFAIGLAVCLIISFYVIDDLTYDRFHKNAKYIYHLLTVDNSENEGALSYSITSGPLVAAMADNIPEIEAATRITTFGNVGFGNVLEEGEEEINERMNVLCLVADTEFFNVFDFEILSGNTEKPMEDLNGIYITPTIAETLFPDQDPIGKPILAGRMQNAYIAGIVQECPQNSHLQYQAIVPLNIQNNPVWWDSWENLALIGYFRINENADPAVVKSKLIEHARESGFAEVFKPDMQPLLDVHLGSGHLRYDFVNFNPNDKLKVYTLGIIAILVLVIASINFINLSSARAARRAREVGMRKIVGGDKKQLFMQFLGESIIITLIAVVIALALFEIALPHLNDFLQKNLSFNLIENYTFTLMIIAVSLIVGILAGIYPALILSNFKPVKVLSGNFTTSKRGVLLRRILVVGQFAVSIALIISVFIVSQQIQYLNSVDLGYNRENVVVVPNFGNNQNGRALKEELKNLSFVESIGVMSNIGGGTLVRLEVIPEGFSEEDGMMFDRLMIDDDLAETLQFRVTEGRDYSVDFASDVDNTCLINSSAVKALGWENPIGKSIVMIDENEARLARTVVGVIEDVNVTTTRRKVNPMILIHSDQFYPRFLVKLKPGIDDEVFPEIMTIVEQFNENANFQLRYFNEIFNFQFRQDRAFATNIAVFSILAILIACLGLFGLASFTTQQRRREVAIRKVMGSSVRSIVFLLAKEFTKWIIIANIIAWPLAWFAMHKWLQNFVYQTNMNLLYFIGSGLLALIIAFVTISFQTIRAANINPVDALQYE
ncbi:MAG: ABC transporter permease [Candidatus Cloacimonetes bacterium]|nr:ABC transporter permease [Candidatus Cloacimonadota bacterium]MCF7814890.1 ABC transporter permease [Candidatus Cloacimonadota bacterium]MCF7869213.1 ABC transporter permease [Candidatus Cloacimonadota bacterium]MCF7884638.1 ABC transporter permease [Candidatus Cloacimonadota bacterium]